MLSTGQACFKIAQHGIKPAELGQIHRFAATRNDHRMHPTHIGYSVETRKTIREDLTFGIQSGARPVFYGRTGESFNGRQSCVDGMSLLIHRDGRDKGHLVFGASSRLTVGSFPAKIGVIGLYGALQRIERFAFQHGRHELVMDAPSRGVAHAKLATQRQCGQPILHLTDQVNRQKPEGQRQTHSLKKGPGNRRSLVAVMAALKCFARAAFQNRMPGSVITLGAMKSVWPPRRFQGCGALFLGTKTLHKIGERTILSETARGSSPWDTPLSQNQWNISGDNAV